MSSTCSSPITIASNDRSSSPIAASRAAAWDRCAQGRLRAIRRGPKNDATIRPEPNRWQYETTYGAFARVVRKRHPE
jgi:hypothetical protein